MIGLSRWCIAHRRRVFVAWVAIAVLTTRRSPGASGATTPRTSACPAPSPSARRPAQEGLPGAERRRRHDRLPHADGTIDAPAVKRRDRAGCSRRSATFPHVVGVISPYGAGGAVEVSQGPHDRVRDDQLRQAREPAARTTPASRVLDQINAVARAGPQGRRRRPGDREGRGLQHRPGDRGRRDRGAGDPADHVRLADRGRACR